MKAKPKAEPDNSLVIVFKPNGKFGEFKSRMAVAEYISEYAGLEILEVEQGQELQKDIAQRAKFIIAGNESKRQSVDVKKASHRSPFLVFMPDADLRYDLTVDKQFDLFVDYKHVPFAGQSTTTLRKFATVPTTLTKGGVINDARLARMHLGLGNGDELITLVLGGNTADIKYGRSHLKAVTQCLEQMRERYPEAKIVVVTSGRTPEKFVEKLQESKIEGLQIISHKDPRKWIYSGIMGASSLIIAPPDSMSVQADAAALGRFYIWGDESMMTRPQQAHVRQLMTEQAYEGFVKDMARFFSEFDPKWHNQKVEPHHNQWNGRDELPSQTALNIALSALRLSVRSR